MAVHNLFSRSLYISSLQDKSRGFHNTFSPQNLYIDYLIKKEVFRSVYNMLRRKVLESIVWTSLEWTFKPTRPNTKFPRPNHAVHAHNFIFPWSALSVVSVYLYNTMQTLMTLPKRAFQ